MPFVGTAAVVLIALIVSASQSVMRRIVVLRAPDQEAVGQLRAPRHVCEGPLTPPASTQSVAIWGSSVIGPAHVRVDVVDEHSARSLATGQVQAGTDSGEYAARLNRSVAGGRPLRVCLTGDLNTFVVLGSPAADPHVVMTGAGPGLEFSLALLNDRHSLLSSLSMAFSRAALFKPSWVGSWTFWLLAAALLATFGLAAVAIATASAEDEAGDPRDSTDGL